MPDNNPVPAQTIQIDPAHAADRTIPITPAPAYDPINDKRPAFEKAQAHPTGATISAAPQPSISERIKKMVTEGIPQYSSRTSSNPEYGKQQFLTPEELLTPAEQRQHPIASGLLDTAGAMTSPSTPLVIGGTGGFLGAGLPGVAGDVITKLLTAGFTYQMAHAALAEYPGMQEAIDNHDMSTATRIGTRMLADIAFAERAGEYPAEGVMDWIQKGAEILKNRPEGSAFAANPEAGVLKVGKGKKSAMSQEMEKLGGTTVRPPTKFTQPEEEKAGAGYHPDLQKIVDKYGTSYSPTVGGSFILPDGKFINLPAGVQHPNVIEEATGAKANTADNRVKFLNDTGAVRVQMQPMTKEGPRVAVSVPSPEHSPLTPDQVTAIQQTVGAAGRGAGLHIERADISAPTADTFSQHKSFASPRDVEGMLRQIGAHPEQAAEAAKSAEAPNTFELNDEAALQIDEQRLEAVASRIQAAGVDPVTAETRARKLIEADSGAPNYSDRDRQEAKILLADYEKPQPSQSISSEDAQRIAEAHVANGGSTFNLTHGDMAGTDNYAVSAHPERGETLDHPPTAEDIQAFADKNKDLLRDSERSLGTWHDTTNNTHALDVVATLPDRDQAVKMGQDNNQKAIFHLKTNTEIPTGGTGEAPVVPATDETPKMATPELQRTMNNVVQNAAGGTFSLDQIKAGDPFISEDGRNAGEAPAWKDGDAGLLHHDGSATIIGGAFIHDPFLESIGEDFDAEGFRKATGSATFDIYDEQGHGAGSPHILSVTLEQPPTPEQMQSMAAMTQHLRAGSENFQKVDVSWPGKDISIDFATPGKVMQELKQATEPVSPSRPQGSTVPLMKNPLVLQPEGEHGPVVLDVQKALDQFAKQGDIPTEPDEQIQHAVNIAHDEIAHQIAEGSEGLGWYDSTVAKAVDHLAELHPVLKDPKTGPAKQTLFKAMWTAASYGNDPDINMDMAEQMFDQYEKTGKIPLDRGHLGEFRPGTGRKKVPMSWAGYSGNVYTLAKTQWLIDKFGEQGAADFLTSKHSLPEIHQAFEGSGLTVNLPKKKGPDAYGARVFGPKGGPFFENLNGIHENTVVDVWGARMLRRWLGTMMDHLGPYDQDSGRLVDNPPTRQEIDQFHQVSKSVAEKLGLDVGDTQALFWYYEHELYRVHGVGEAANDYAKAARAVVDRRKGVQPGGDAAAGGAPEAGGQGAPAAKVSGSGQGLSETHEVDDGDTSFDTAAFERGIKKLSTKK